MCFCGSGVEVSFGGGGGGGGGRQAFCGSEKSLFAGAPFGACVSIERVWLV
jgi:hypothetical protein